MQRVLRQILRAAVLPIFVLLAVAISPIGGVASAASPSTICPNYEGIYCDLVISAPDSVATGQPFVVQVEIWAGEGGIIPSGDPCGLGARVTLVVSYLAGDEQWFQVTYFANALNGVATFNVAGLPPDAWSTSLDASATQASGKCQYANSSENELTVLSVDSGQPVYPCPPGVVCVQKTSDGGTAATLYADTGSFVAYFVPFDPADGCGDTGPLDPKGVLYFTYDGQNNPSPKTIIFALSPFLVTKGIGQYQVCWNSANAFTPLGGGDQVYFGYLPDCKKGDLGPCVVSRTSDQYNAGYFEVRAPEEDPKGYVW